MVDNDRSLLKLILFSVLTCGIYMFYFFYKLSFDINIICEGDGGKTTGALKFFFFTLITLGIYQYYWYYSLGNRLADNAPRYGMEFEENGKEVFNWMFFGAFLLGVGPFIAWHILIKNTNALATAYLNCDTSL